MIDINHTIKQMVVSLRKEYKIKLPDAIIAATALYLDLPLLTADAGFKKIQNMAIIFYEQ